MTRSTKICIYGAGALGSYLAARLAEAEGVDLSIVARGKHLDAIRATGLSAKFAGRQTRISIDATDNAAELDVQDYVISTLRAHQTIDAAQKMAALLDRESTVVTLQAGVPFWYFYGLHGSASERHITSVDPDLHLWSTISPERALGGVCCGFKAKLTDAGMVQHIQGNRLLLGEPDGSSSKRAKALSSIMESVGLDAPIVADIRRFIWSNLRTSVAFDLLGTSHRKTIAAIATDSETVGTAKTLMREAEAIGLALGVEFRHYIETALHCARNDPDKPPMLHDLENGRTLELDALVAALLELGAIARVPCPTIAAWGGRVRVLAEEMGVLSVAEGVERSH